MGESVKELEITYSVWCIVTEHEVLEDGILSVPIRQAIPKPLDISNHASVEGALKFIEVMRKSFLDAVNRKQAAEAYKKETH